MAYQSIFELLLKISADGTRELEKVQKQFGAVGKSGQDAGWTIGRAWKTAGAALGTAAVSFYAVKKAVDAAAFAEMKTNMQTAFAALRTEALPGIAAVQAAFRGLVDDDAAARIGSQFANLGLDAEQMGQAADAAFKLAAASGGDAQGATEMLTQAMGTGRATALKQWGVMLDLDASYKEYAAKIGVTAEALDEETKAQIRVSETLDAVQAAFARLDTSKLRTDMQAASVAMADMVENAKEFAGEGVIFGVKIIDMVAMAAAELASGGRLSRALHDQRATINAINQELADNAELRAEEAEAAQRQADYAGRVASRLRVQEKAYADLDKAIAALSGEQGITEKSTQALAEALYGNQLATADTAAEVEKYQQSLTAIAPTLEAYGDLLGWQDDKLFVMVQNYRLLEIAAETRRNSMLLEEQAAKRTAEAWESLGRGMGKMPAAMPVRRAPGVAKAAVSRPESIEAEEADIRRIIASAQDELTRITAEAELDRYQILRDFNAQKIDGQLLGLRMYEANAQEEADILRYKLAVEGEAERDAARLRDELRRAESEALAAAEREEAEQHRLRMDRMEEFRMEMASQVEALRANFDAMSMMGWEFAGQMSQAMDGAEDAATAFATAAIMGQKSYAKTIPTGIAASGRLAAAFIKDIKIQAIIRGAFETAAALSSLASSDLVGAALHGASAAMFFMVAAKGGGKPAMSSAGAGKGAGGGLASDRSALGSGQTGTTINAPIYLSGFAIGSEAQLGQHVGNALNAVAGRLVLDRRLTGVQVVGF